MWQCVAVLFSVLRVVQCVVACCSALYEETLMQSPEHICVAVCCSVLQCIAVYRNVLQCVAVLRLLQCVVAVCSVLQRIACVAVR